MSVELPPITIVVIGRNEGERLVRCLESAHRADYPKDRIELIYVDSDSTDASCAVAERLGAKVIAIRPERPCAAAARNAGLAEASHELIQFLDGDTILDPAWLKAGVAAIDDPSIACVFGRVEEVDPTATIYNFWAHHDWYVPPGPAEACGGVALFRRALLLEAGAYDSSLIAGEERDLCYRLIRDYDAVIVSTEAAMVQHDIAMTCFRQYWSRCVRAGYAYAEVGTRYAELRSWRRTVRRNIAHAVVGAGTFLLSFATWSFWPILLWAGLLSVAVARNTIRHRRRLGSTVSAAAYAFHHYCSKIPNVVGHLDYYTRDILGLSPRGLIEHKGDLDRPGC